MICRYQTIGPWHSGGCMPIWQYAVTLGVVLGVVLVARWAIDRWRP